MTGDFTKIIVVAQAEGDTLQEGELLNEEHAAGADEHAAGTEAPAGEVPHAPTVFPPFNPEYFAGQVLWFAITFAALYFIISRIAIPQIGGILESRRTRIDGDLKEADRLRVETDRALAAYEQALAEARANAHAIAEETRQGIRADIEGKRAKVEGDLSAKVTEAEARIAATKTAALGNVDQIAADTAAALVSRLTGSVSEAEAREAVAAVAKG